MRPEEIVVGERYRGRDGIIRIVTAIDKSKVDYSYTCAMENVCGRMGIAMFSLFARERVEETTNA
jgi:hypothetical protein